MNLNQLYYFQAIARLQHYGKAAEQLNIAQPSLSKSMANLEEELGLYLFEKSGRNVVLTKYGQIFLGHVDAILSEVEAAEKKMKQLASPQEGHVDIAYVSPLARHYIPHTVRQFLSLEKNRQITFSFSQEMTSVMIAGLKAETYDVVFGSYVENEPALYFVPILTQEMIVIAPEGHPLSKLDSVSLEEIEPYPFVAYDRSSGLGIFTRKILEQRQLHPAVVCESSDEHGIAELVAMDFGIALVADVNALREINVCRIPVKGEKIQHTVYMIYHKYRYLPPSVMSFISFIKKQTEQDS